MKKSLTAMAALLFTALVADTSTAQSSTTNFYVELDPTSIFDLHIDQLSSTVQHTPASGIFVLSTNTPTCTTCSMVLDYIGVTFDDFALTVKVTNAAGLVGTADVTIAQPTIAIMGPITMRNTSSGLVVPSGTTVSMTATVSGRSSFGSIPSQRVGGLTQLTRDLFMHVGTPAHPSLTITGASLPFQLNMQDTIGGQAVTLDLTGTMSIMGSGLPAFHPF